jgi:hypothetical protein
MLQDLSAHSLTQAMYKVNKMCIALQEGFVWVHQIDVQRQNVPRQNAPGYKTSQKQYVPKTIRPKYKMFRETEASKPPNCKMTQIQNVPDTK